MCGIAGVIQKSNKLIDWIDYINLFTQSMVHRGPDDSGVYQAENFLAVHARLAIVDINGGKQPIYNDDQSIGLIYNGEIYNHLTLRKDLEASGYLFQTNSDTEVILRSYEKWGTKAFNLFNGMFAFCLWDHQNEEIYLVRDQIGMKPLYIYEDTEKLIFASELKTILAVPDIDLTFDPFGFQDYLTFRYIQAPYTLFKNIRVLEAGTYLEYKQGNSTHWRYWDISYQDTFPPQNFQEASEELDRRLKKAVKSQLMGEVPIGVLLSGGIDSSTIAYYVHEAGANLTTFNIGFPKLNEFEFSRAVANQFDLNHITIETTVNQLIVSLDLVFLAMDSPIADPACLPLFQLGTTLKQYVTVVLSGEAGDELFAGYPQYLYGLENSTTIHNQFEAFLSRSYYFLETDKFMTDKNLAPAYLRYRRYFTEFFPLNGMLAYDMKTWMPENLMMKADKILMAHSLEGRFPFLDKDVIEFSLKLCQDYKLHPQGLSKWILKNVMKKRLPEQIIQRRKMGFSVPVNILLSELKDLVKSVFRSARDTPVSTILDVNELEKICDDYYSQINSNSLQLWTIFTLLYWLSYSLENFRLCQVSLPGKTGECN